MSGVKVQRGERITADRLFIVVKDEFGAPVVPFSIFYSIYDRTGYLPILFGEERQAPLGGGNGQFGADYEPFGTPAGSDCRLPA